MTDAARCRKNGWKVGDVLRGTERCWGGPSTSMIQITAIGEEKIMAKTVWRDGNSNGSSECVWCLDMRRWRKVNESRF